MDRRFEELKKELQDAAQVATAAPAASDPGEPPASAGDAGGQVRRSLVCESDPKLAQSILRTLQRMGYQTEQAASAREALRKIERGAYAVITINSAFPDDPAGGKSILSKINSRKIEQRRETFAVLLSPGVATAGSASAFLQGANITVNLADLKSLEKLILQGQEEFRRIFQP